MQELKLSISNLRERKNKFNIITVLAGFPSVKKVSINEMNLYIKFDAEKTDEEKIKKFLEEKGFVLE